jgi:hypothetical protein
MMALLCFFLTLFASLFKSKSRLEAENAALRHQLAEGAVIPNLRGAVNSIARRSASARPMVWRPYNHGALAPRDTRIVRGWQTAPMQQ